MRERRIYPPTVWTFNAPHSDGKTPVEIPYSLYRHAIENHRVGDVIRSYASAPGTGYVDQKITRIDETGVYAVTVESTVRELQPWDVR